MNNHAKCGFGKLYHSSSRPCFFCGQHQCASNKHLEDAWDSQKFIHYRIPKSYEDAKAAVTRGRPKGTRYVGKNTRLQEMADGNIQLTYMSRLVAIYRPDMIELELDNPASAWSNRYWERAGDVVLSWSFYRHGHTNWHAYRRGMTSPFLSKSLHRLNFNPHLKYVPSDDTMLGIEGPRIVGGMYKRSLYSGNLNGMQLISCKLCDRQMKLLEAYAICTKHIWRGGPYALCRECAEPHLVEHTMIEGG